MHNAQVQSVKKLRFYAFHSGFSFTAETTDGYMRLAHEHSPKEQDPNQAWATAFISDNHPGVTFPTEGEQTRAASFPQMADNFFAVSFSNLLFKVYSNKKKEELVLHGLSIIKDSHLTISKCLDIYT